MSLVLAYSIALGQSAMVEGTLSEGVHTHSHILQVWDPLPSFWSLLICFASFLYDIVKGERGLDTINQLIAFFFFGLRNFQSKLCSRVELICLECPGG